MVLDILIRQDGCASQLVVVANELDVFKLLLDLFLYRNKFGLLAHHRTLAGLFCEFIKADLVEAIVTLFAFPWLYKDGLTKCT